MKVLRPVWPRPAFVAFALLIAILTWRFGHVGLVPAVAISLCTLFANGLFATHEDYLPGGFNNPDGPGTFRYARVLTGVTRSAFMLLCLLLAAFLFVSASGVGFGTTRGAALACLGLAPACAYVAVSAQRRIALAALIVVIGGGLLLAWVGRGF